MCAEETNDLATLSTPDKIARAAVLIYENDFKHEFEENHKGQFAAIDVVARKAYTGQFAEDAILKARKSAPHGVFHLIRIGAPSAFKVSYVYDHDACWNWPLRPAR